MIKEIKSKGILFSLVVLMLLLLANGAFALTISNVEIKSITSSSARITWDTDAVADGKVRYGQTSDLGLTSRHNTYIFEHDQLLQGLESGTTYLFKINPFVFRMLMAKLDLSRNTHFVNNPSYPK